jgi:1A family penicillin-binding protein
MYGKEKRTVVPLEKIPEYLKKAVILTEDERFYQHFGLDFKAILRAFWVNLKLGKPIQGGSTIPQQLIRSSFLTREKTLSRKIKEIILTLELSRRYSKDQILEFYLNQIPLGSNCYGVEAASQTYFKKSVSEISLAEAVILASLIRAPSYLSPYGENKEELLKRKDFILDKMAKRGFITEKEAKEAKEEKIKFAKILTPIKAPHFVIEVKNYLEKEYGEDFLKEKGLKVFTTLDFELQELAEKIIKERSKINEKYNAHNAALVALDPKKGEILAMVGSKDWFLDPYPQDCQEGLNCLFEPKVNVATFKIGRQPGSAFKPFAYALAFQKGYLPETIVWDVKTNFGGPLNPYIPYNYDYKFRGPISLREALAQSINVASIKVLYLAGLKETLKLAKKLGITTLNKDPSYYGLPLVLGGGEVKLLEMVSAYGVFAREGLKISPSFILKIEDSKGNIIEKIKKTPKRVLDIQTCRLINDVLSDNKARAPMFGWQSSLYIKDYQVAAKTGTTQNYKDAWIIGYTPNLVTGVWVGNNDSTPMAKKPGVALSGPIWKNFMEKALLKFPKEDFQKPDPIFVEKPILKGKIDYNNPHSILHYVEKNNPRGEIPKEPWLDPQYSAWEEGIKNYLKK